MLVAGGSNGENSAGSGADKGLPYTCELTDEAGNQANSTGTHVSAPHAHPDADADTVTVSVSIDAHPPVVRSVDLVSIASPGTDTRDSWRKPQVDDPGLPVVARADPRPPARLKRRACSSSALPCSGPEWQILSS